MCEERGTEDWFGPVRGALEEGCRAGKDMIHPKTSEPQIGGGGGKHEERSCTEGVLPAIRLTSPESGRR